MWAERRARCRDLCSEQIQFLSIKYLKFELIVPSRPRNEVDVYIIIAYLSDKITIYDVF